MSETDEPQFGQQPPQDGHELLVRAALAAVPGLVMRYGHRNPENIAVRAFAIGAAFVAESNKWQEGEES